METLLIIDDDLSLLESLKMHFEEVEEEGAPRYQVATATSAAAGLKAAAEISPSLVILDMMLPDRTGLQIIEEMRSLCGDAPILIVTAHHDMETTIRAMKAGAIDFIEKPFSDQLLLDRIWQAIDRDREARRAEAIRAAVSQRLARLTPREREVMRGLIEGKTSREIATELHLSARTVEAHRAQVLAKMEVDSGTKLVRLVLVAGFRDDEVPTEAC